MAPFSKRLRQLLPQINERTKHTEKGSAIKIDRDFAKSLCTAMDNKYTFTEAVETFINQETEVEQERQNIVTKLENTEEEDENVSETYETIDIPPESVSSDDESVSSDDESSSCEDEEDEYN